MQSNQGEGAATDPGSNGKIAFSNSRYDYPYSDIYVMNAADGSGVTRLTNSTGFDSYGAPSWSPD
jgi:Tol biopolymer transport system component